MLNKSMISTLLAAVAAVTVAVSHAAAQDKLQFRLNWTIYGEHAPFFVAKDKGFYKDEGLDVEILEGSGSTTVAQLVANLTNPIAYVDVGLAYVVVSSRPPFLTTSTRSSRIGLRTLGRDEFERMRVEHDARHRRGNAYQGGRRDASAKPDGLYLSRRRGPPHQDR